MRKRKRTKEERELDNDRKQIQQTRKSLVMEKAVALRSRGTSWGVIAEECGFKDGSAASSSVHAYLKRMAASSNANIESYRQQLLHSLEEMEREVWKVLERKHVTVSAGKIVQRMDPESGKIEDLEDDAPVLQAVDRLLKVYERKSKMLGLDMNADVAVGVSVHHTINGVSLEDLS